MNTRRVPLESGELNANANLRERFHEGVHHEFGERRTLLCSELQLPHSQRRNTVRGGIVLSDCCTVVAQR